MEDCGHGHNRMQSTFLESASIPFVEMWCPRKSIDVQYRCVFLGLKYSLAA